MYQCHLTVYESALCLEFQEKLRFEENFLSISLKWP